MKQVPNLASHLQPVPVRSSITKQNGYSCAFVQSERTNTD